MAKRRSSSTLKIGKYLPAFLTGMAAIVATGYAFSTFKSVDFINTARKGFSGAL